MVLIVISSGEKWLTSRLILQLSCPVRTSETPLVSRPRSSWFNCCWPTKGGKSGDCVNSGHEKDPSLLLAQSIQSRSPGSKKGGRPKSCKKTWLVCVQLGKDSQPTSRRKMGRGNILFCSSIGADQMQIWIQDHHMCEQRSEQKGFLWFHNAPLTV